jgi:ABC-type siderophore export system fused ATPase/permease subunit
MRRILDFGLVSPGYFVLLVLSSILNGAGTMLLLHLVSQEMVDEGLPYAIPIFLSVLVITFLIQEASARFAIRRTQNFLQGLRGRLLDQVLDAEYAHAEQLDRAKFMSAISQDSNLIAALLPSLVTCAAAMTTIILLLIFIGTISWLAVAVCLVLMALGILIFQLTSRSAHVHILSSYGAQDRVVDLFGSSLNMLAFFKQSDTHRQNVLRPLFEEKSQLTATEGIIGHSRLATASNSTYMLLFVVLGVVVFALPAFGLADHNATVAITSGLLFLAMPFARLVSSASVLPFSVLAIERIMSLENEVNAGPKETFASLTQGQGRDWSQIALRNIEFQYRPGGLPGFRLGPVSLELHKGEVLFITGFNGAGKTTLGKVLTGLYQPDEGEIMLDGKTIQRSDIGEYRTLFSIIHREQQIDDGLFRADKEAFAALSVSAAALGYDPEVLPSTDDGRDLALLSTGQQRRLLLFFAYHARRPILFLDEWAADQDPKARKFFYETVLSRLRDQRFTVVAISHDDAYFHHADRVIEITSDECLDPVAESDASMPLAASQ